MSPKNRNTFILTFQRAAIWIDENNGDLSALWSLGRTAANCGFEPSADTSSARHTALLMYHAVTFRRLDLLIAIVSADRQAGGALWIVLVVA